MSKKMRKLTSDEVSYFCCQLAMILDSGVPLYDGLTVLAAETRDKSSDEANALMDSIIGSLASEKPLYAALEDTGLFPVYCVKTVMAGELSGRLYEALSELSDYYEKDAAMRDNIRSAVVSPIIMLVIASAVIAVLIIKILPMFAEIFADSAPEIYSTITKSVNISAAAGTVMLIICGAAVLISAAFYLIWSCGETAKIMEIAAKFPLTRKTAEAVSLAKFSGAVSMMIGSGLSPAQALQNAKGISSNPVIDEKIDRCADMVMNDVPFSDAIEQTELLPVFYAQTLRVSYRSGSFDTAWKKISSKLREEADARLRGIISAAEPALTTVLTISAGVIMLTVMIPLMNIMSAL